MPNKPIQDNKILEQMSVHIKDLAGDYIQKNNLMDAYNQKKIAVVQEFNTLSYKGMEDNDGLQRIWIEGYLSTFKNSDRASDVVHENAFNDTLTDISSRGMFPLLKNHWPITECQLGAWTEFKVDSVGLWVKGYIIIDEESRHEVNLIKAGALNTLSMGGIFVYDHQRDEQGNYVILKVILLEGSIVTIPCNPKATFTMKSFSLGEKFHEVGEVPNSGKVSEEKSLEEQKQEKIQICKGVFKQ